MVRLAVFAFDFATAHLTAQTAPRPSGVIILADFIIQTTSAYMNRRHVEKLSAECEKRGDAPLDISIAVVGYREDSEAWKKCLHSLQKQEAAPKAIIGVVDGQDGPDQSMAEDFVGAFPPGTVLIGDFDTLLSKLYTTTYWANIPAEFHSKTWKAKAARLIRSIANTRTADEFKAEAIAWKAVYAKLDEWNEKFKIDQYKAICFTQPHGHKRVSCQASAGYPTGTDSDCWAAADCHVHCLLDRDAHLQDQRCCIHHRQ